ncbi:hypothetical protein AN958_05717 [Leucoagaricus sp. SymC.cos]|nr:hypothetical protein AN958_05717 [Leucoagaricus sp. SymC.cos]
MTPIQGLVENLESISITNDSTNKKYGVDASNAGEVVKLIQQRNLSDQDKIEIVQALLQCSLKPFKTPKSKLMTDRVKVQATYAIVDTMSAADRLKTMRHLVKGLDGPGTDNNDWIDDMGSIKVILKENRAAYKKATTENSREHHLELFGIERLPRLSPEAQVTMITKQLKEQLYTREMPTESASGGGGDDGGKDGIYSATLNNDDDIKRSTAPVREDTDLLGTCTDFWNTGIYISREILLDKYKQELETDGPVYKKIEPVKDQVRTKLRELFQAAKGQSEMRSRTFIDVWLHALWRFQQALTGASRLYHEVDLTRTTPVSITHNSQTTMLTGRADYVVVHPRLPQKATRLATATLPNIAKKVMDLDPQKDLLESIRLVEFQLPRGKAGFNIQILLVEAKRQVAKSETLLKHEPQVIAQCVAW